MCISTMSCCPSKHCFYLQVYQSDTNFAVSFLERLKTGYVAMLVARFDAT